MSAPIISHTQVIADHPNHGKRMGEPGFTYIPANKTDIVKVFRSMGWVPPSEARGQSMGEAA
jgi:hypothetical protein